MKIKGLEIKAFDSDNKEVESFSIFFKGRYAFGIAKEDSTEREIYELRVAEQGRRKNGLR